MASPAGGYAGLAMSRPYGGGAVTGWRVNFRGRPLLGIVAGVALTAAMMSVAPPVGAATVPWGTVLVPGSSWAGSSASLGDLNVYSNGTGNQDQWGPYGWDYECFELAARWAEIAYGDPWNGWDASYAYQMYATGPYQTPPFLQQPNGGTVFPAFGDLLVFDQTSFDPSGHVAVVSGVGNGYVNIVEQNWGDPDPTGYAQLPIGGDVGSTWDPTYMPPRWGLPILGWLQSSVAPASDLGPVGPGSQPALPSETAPSSPVEPGYRVTPPTPTAVATPLPTSTPSADPAIGTVGPSASPPTTLPAGATSAPPPCGCTWGAQFLPTGEVARGPNPEVAQPPPSPSLPVAGASSTPEVRPEISSMPPKDVPPPPIL